MTSDILAVDWDTTLFSLADSNYHGVVEFLLQSIQCTGLSKAELTAFQTEFGGTAFICPVRKCDRSLMGFSSAARLKEHKIRRHRKRPRCYRGRCIHNDVGFSSESSLQQHVQKVHQKETQRIPTSLKRKRRIEDTQPPEDTQLSHAEHNEASQDDCLVVHNSDLPRALNMDLLHTLTHKNLIYCVSFSIDGKFVATGNLTVAQIFDVISGEKVCVLHHDDLLGTGRNLCFSPNSRYLATGGRDRRVRVSFIVWFYQACSEFITLTS